MRSQRRRSESESERRLRLATAQAELARYREFDYLVINPEGGLSQAVADTLAILRAELSPNLPPEHAERLRAAIGNATVVEIPGAYHHVTLDAPDAVVAALDRFLRSLQ